MVNCSRRFAAQADALTIEAQAKRRLAEEYDAAQDSGAVAKHGGMRGNQFGNVGECDVATSADIGLCRFEIYQAREIPRCRGCRSRIVRRTLDDAIAAGEEPTKAKVRRAGRRRRMRQRLSAL